MNTPCRVTADLRRYEAEQDAAAKRGDAFADRVSEIERAMTNDEIAVEIMEGNAIDEGCVEILTMVLNGADAFRKLEREGVIHSLCAFELLNHIDVGRAMEIASKARYRAAEAMAEKEGF